MRRELVIRAFKGGKKNRFRKLDTFMRMARDGFECPPRLDPDTGLMTNMQQTIVELQKIKEPDEDEHKFFRAVIKRDLNAIHLYLIYNESLINSVDCRGNTALHYAVKYDDIHLAETILNKGVRIDALNIYGKSALDIAISNEQYKMARIISRWS